MSKQAINQYYNKIGQYKQFGGTRNELSLRRAFANLLEEYCASKHLLLVDEVQLTGTQKRPDGTVKDANRFDWGYWESKDPHDNLNAAIAEKIALGYPTFNILFENTLEIVLIQHGEERLRGDMRDADRLHRTLTAFVEYERPEIARFREAVEQFKQDIPEILQTLRQLMSEQSACNPAFQRSYQTFWRLCQESINPEISAFDIQEMLIQHILTAEIFDTVFGDSHFHRENNIARELEQVVNTFFTGATRRNTLAKIENYYNAIKAEAARIQNHHEKQAFLKVVYENFYKAYNPKGADRLGIVYTPNEIVKFMLESTDYLLDRHFNKSLAAKDVEILDPATGTGTFITEIIEHIPAQYLAHKYAREIHANEVAILPYYIANLNIEYTYQQKMGQYAPFKNIVFVDTLDNLGFDLKGKQGTFKGFGGSVENLDRIQRQNERKISVIIGNPPYNANQMNENDNNKNREYFENTTKKTGGVDGRIKETYIKASTAQKTKVYDMYARFIRWASDRLHENGVIAFITNRSYIDSRTFDGFRKCAANEFDAIYIVDTQSDVRKNPKIAGTTHNVFGIQTGVALMFLVRTAHQKRRPAKIQYFSLTDEMRKREKLEWLRDHPFKQIPFETVTPDAKGNWINIADNDFDTLLATRGMQAVFGFHSLGVSTNRDEWVFDVDQEQLIHKIQFFCDNYNNQITTKQTTNEKNISETVDYSIKWSEKLKSHFLNRVPLIFNQLAIIDYQSRPYNKRFYYSDKMLSDRLTSNHYEIFSKNLQAGNPVITFSGVGSSKAFAVLAVKKIFSLDLLEKTQCFPLYRYDKDGNRLDNITDWGWQQFRQHYPNESISKEDIFHYAYAVLHNPAYRRKYELNLKREFPRLPLYQDFAQWAAWGRQLMDWHIHYETIEPYPLTIQEARERKDAPKAKLRALPEQGQILLDENTTLTGVPDAAWRYTLGNRSALHWILDQYKEKKPTDKTIAEQFNTYKFADYKERVIDLLQRVCAVSVNTVEIMDAMQQKESHSA